MSFLLRVLAVAGLLSTVLSLAPAEAYGRDGHRIVCDLAYRYLSEETRS